MDVDEFLQSMDLDEIFERMHKSWFSELVSRTSVEVFSGGLLNDKTLANLAVVGKGPKQIKIGRKIAYPKKELIEWMKAKATIK